MIKLSRIFPALIFWGIFILAIFQIPYPENLTQASLIQILAFFIPLFLASVFTLNIFLKNIFSAGSISLGVIFILILKALDSLNMVTSTLTIIAIAFLISYFRKTGKKSLTKWGKIPKLTRLKKGN